MQRPLISVLVLVVVLSFSASVMAEELIIVGTGDGVAILNALGEAFKRANPEVDVIVPKSIGSGGGVKAVGRDENKIGRVARKIKEKEKNYGLTYVPYAKVPTVFFVNKSVKVTDLTAKQVCDIYSGKITNWQDVGGNNARIRVVRREDGDSSFGVLLKSFPGFKDISITSVSKTAYSTPDNISDVKNKAGAIGFGPYDVVKQTDMGILAIDGKKPTDAGYPSSGTLGLIFKEKNKTGNLKKFVEFVTSAEAHSAIKDAGGIPF